LKENQGSFHPEKAVQGKNPLWVIFFVTDHVAFFSNMNDQLLDEDQQQLVHAGITKTP
jgi:hypothetical protein